MLLLSLTVVHHVASWGEITISVMRIFINVLPLVRSDMTKTAELKPNYGKQPTWKSSVAYVSKL